MCCLHLGITLLLSDDHEYPVVIANYGNLVSRRTALRPPSKRLVDHYADIVWVWVSQPRLTSLIGTKQLLNWLRDQHM